jgi:hypothetical protein
MMMQTQHNKWIWIALLITLLLSWEALRHPSNEISQPTRQLSNVQMARLTMQQTSQAPQELHLQERTLLESQYDLFAVPFVPAPINKKALVTKAPPPQAPPLPFQYLGRIKIGDSDGILLNIDGEVSPIKQGDYLLGEQYQVQSIQAKQVQFLYKPLNQVQILNLP